MEKQELIIATFNISGGYYVGNEESEYLDREAADEVDKSLLNQIFDVIQKEHIDVLCFQEIITTKEIMYLETIAQNTPLKYYDFYELSECNVVKNTRCGIAIFSRYPLHSIKKELFPNPMLSFTTKSLNTYYTYDRGYMICEVELDNTRFRILNHHGFPYRRFHSTPEKNKKVFEFFDDVISQYHPNVVLGDFNAEHFMDFMNDTSKNYKRIVNDVTTVDGMKFDDILVKNNICASSKIVPLLSDHFLVLAYIEMKEDE